MFWARAVGVGRRRSSASITAADGGVVLATAARKSRLQDMVKYMIWLVGVVLKLEELKGSNFLYTQLP